MVFLFYLSALLVLTFNVRKWGEGDYVFYGWQILKIFTAVGYLFFLQYLQLVDITFTAWLSHVGWMLAILWVVEFFILEGSQSIVSLVQTIVGLLAILGYVFILFIYPVMIVNDKYKATEAKIESTDLPQTDEQNIVSVPMEYAKYKAEKLIGEMKDYSYYELGIYSIQKINGKLVYVTPVEFSGFSTWNRSGKKVPGYIQVDATDENAEAKFVKEEMKYTPSSYFGDNLLRKVRKQYPDVLLLEASFEPDDNGKPYYAVTYATYKNFRSIPKVGGIILFDPKTGDMKQYPNGKIPKFIDQLIPGDEIATPYNEWFGKYADGWINSWWGKKDIKVPTEWGIGSEVAPVYNNEGDMSWFTDFTTLNENASSMVGYSMMDAKTGKLTYYHGKNANGLINGDSAKRAVDKSFTKDKWHGTQPMLYNIYGEMTWFLPVIDADGLLRSYALVNAKDPKVLATSDTKKQAFENYKRLLVTKLHGSNVTPGQGIDFVEKTGVIISKEVVSKENDAIVYIQIDNDKTKVYQLSMSKHPYAIALEKGQTVSVKYIDTDETIVEIQEMRTGDIVSKGIKKEKTDH